MTLHSRQRVADARLMPLAVDYASYRRKVIFQCFKWDPQVGDAGTIADHACILSSSAAAQLEQSAEALAAETLAMEEALQARPGLHRELGIGRTLSNALLAGGKEDRSVRVMRFDFHPTAQGWALSEVNSDVPGGFAEASALPVLAAAHVSGARPGRDTAAVLAAALSRRLESSARILLVHATAYADDRQVMQFLAARFAQAGFRCALAAPDHVRWSGGEAWAIGDGMEGRVDGIVRFFPADWLPGLPRQANWRGYFDGKALSCNPVRALLSQSKRSPLAWDRLGLALPAWRSLLPETRDPRDAPWQRDEGWLVKPAFGRVGEGLAWRGGVARNLWRRTQWKAWMAPRRWVAQRRFESLPLAGRDGPRHLCIGVFTVDGKAAGFYGRLSARRTIEKHAQDVAVLVQEEPACP